MIFWLTLRKSVINGALALEEWLLPVQVFLVVVAKGIPPVLVAVVEGLVVIVRERLPHLAQFLVQQVFAFRLGIGLGIGLGFGLGIGRIMGKVVASCVCSLERAAFAFLTVGIEVSEVCVRNRDPCIEITHRDSFVLDEARRLVDDG